MKENVVLHILVKLMNIMHSYLDISWLVLTALSCLCDVVLQCSVVRSANSPIKKDHSSWMSRWPCQTGSDRAYRTTKYTISLFCFLGEAVVNESHWG